MSERPRRSGAEDPGQAAGVLGSSGTPPRTPAGTADQTPAGTPAGTAAATPGGTAAGTRAETAGGIAGATDTGSPVGTGVAPPAAGGLAALDDVDAEVYTIGQAASLLGVPVAALRRLDDAGALRPGRSAGRQRRYSRRQLQLAQRVLALVADGTAITAARRIADLEGEVRDLREQLDRSSVGREPGQLP